MGKGSGRIALIGLRGSGKSTVGSKLAARLGVPFHDSDDAVTARHGRTPAELIRGEGEAEFRRREHEVVADLATESHGVLALGGGAPCDPRNRAVLASWTVVLLDAADAELHRRLALDDTDRPPLTDAGNAEVAVLRERRWSDYLALDPLVIATDDLDADAVAGVILERIGGDD